MTEGAVSSYDNPYLSLIDNVVSAQQVLTIVVIGIFFFALCRPYMKRKLLSFFWLSGAYSLLLSVFYLLPEDLQPPRGISFLTRVFGGFLIIFVLERRYPLRSLFLSLSYYTITYITVRMSSEQNSFLSDALYSSERIISDVDATIRAFVFIQFENVAFLSALLSITVFFFHKVCRFPAEELTKKSFLILSIPPLVQLIQGFLYVDYYTMYTEYAGLLIETGRSADNPYFTWSSWYRLAENGLFLLFWMIFLFLFSDMKRLSRREKEELVLNEHKEQLSQRIAQAENFYKEISGMRHDMNHHIQIISALLEENNIKEAKDYIARMEEGLKITEIKASTGHPVTDLIISEMVERAREKGAVLSYDFTFPKGAEIDSFDLSVILGNGLMNALEATSYGGEIVLRSYMKKNAFLTEIENPLEGSFEIDPESGFPISTKKGPGHGIGLLNVKRIAEKYNGDVILEKRGETAVLSVLLQLRN